MIITSEDGRVAIKATYAYDPDGTIFCVLAMSHLRGTDDECRQLELEARERYIGRPVSDWTRDEYEQTPESQLTRIESKLNKLLRSVHTSK